MSYLYVCVLRHVSTAASRTERLHVLIPAAICIAGFSLGLSVPLMVCPKTTLVPPQNQHIFNTHLNYLNLKTVWALNIEISEH